MSTTAPRSVLVVHDVPDDMREVLEPRLGGRVDLHYAGAPHEVVPALEAHRPEAVLSIKHDGFPGPAHRPVVEHPSVRWVHVGGSGYDHLQPWDPARVTVTNSAGVLSGYLAETVTGAVLALNGHFPAYLDQQRRHEWRRHPFRPLSEQTLLVVGLGHIGGHVAANARALGMRVLATRRRPSPHPHADEVHPPDRLADLLGRADVVSLHVRLGEQTRHLIDAAAIAAMRPGAILVNTSRGAVVDEAALVDALGSGHLRGVYLDVFETEPLPADSPLWDLPGVLLTPHTSDNVVDWPKRFAALFADNLERWLAGEPLRNVVSQ